ncbi:MAG: efflux RND transporter permease subunit [Candidatus Sumerlaeaceae bacterium]|nr:efflux RND transporter permease subunit [Candidatus Sumerlaeaceae bacterium]
MLKKLIALSLRSPGLVLGTALMLLGFTLYQLPRMPVDVFPELNAPTVVIMTEARGLAADEVEQFVTFPIESSVNGLVGVRRVRSSSAMGLSIVWVEFDWGQDIYRARQQVSERLTSARESLPPNAHAELTPVSSITGEIMLISLSSPDGTVNPLELRAHAEFDLRNRLLAVPGISQVVAIGGELPEYQINLKQDKLLLYGLTGKDVEEAARKAHTIASAGFLPNVEGRELPIRQSGRVQSISDISATVIKYHNGAAVTIGQVADVRLAGAPRRGTASEAGHKAVVISIQKAPGANTLALTKQLDKTFDELEPALPKGIKLNRHIMRQSDFISLSVNNVIKVSRDAAILVAVILILFLMNVRTTIITLTALPLSVAAAMLIMDMFGLSINVMTLGGIAVAIGELVDDAIIDVENVFRRLRENAAQPSDKRRGILQVVFDASNEIRSSVVFATIIIIVVFVPLLFLQGLEGRFFRPLGIAYITSILASLFVALTVTPAMCYLLLRGNLGSGDHGDGWLVRKLKGLYEPALSHALGHRKAVIGVAAGLTVLSLALGASYGTSFLPEFNEGTFTVFLMAPPGTSLEESDRLATNVERHMARIEGVRSVVRRTGRAERDEHAEPVSSSEIEVTLKPGIRKDQVREAINGVMKDIPGITTMIGQPIEHRLSHILSGTPAAIAINVYGDDLSKLRALARKIEGELKNLPGTRDVAANREVMIDSVPVSYRAADLALWGLTPADAAEQVEMAFSGSTVAEVNQGTRRIQMNLRLAPDQRQTIAQLKEFILRAPSGALVRLEEVASIGVEKTSNLIARENGRRKATVSCNVAPGHNLGDLIKAVRARVDPIVNESGYSVHYGGQFEAQQSASKTIYIMGIGVVAVILMLLNMAFGSLRAALLVIVNLPLALIGGIVAIFLTESPSVVGNLLGLFGVGHYTAPVISIASMVGFVTLFGIAVRNGILLVNHYNHLMREDGLHLKEAVVRGSRERLVPILMTALTAILGLLPLGWAGGEPGSELLAPLANVVLGGLVTSTVLNLFVVPAGFMLFFHGRKGGDADPEPPPAGIEMGG